MPANKRHIGKTCSVCFHTRKRQIEGYMKQDTAYAPILRWLREQNKIDPAVRTYSSKDPLKRHREDCMGLQPLAGFSGVGPALVEVEATGEDISPEIIGLRARQRLAGKLDELSAKELHVLVVESMKLEREKVKRAKDEGYDDDDEAASDVKGAAKDFDDRVRRIDEYRDKA